MILYGTPVREEIKEKLIERVKKLGKAPVLAIVQVGGREDSNVYIKQKQKFGAEIGAEVLIKKFDENISENALIEEIKKLNDDENINGIIVQLPLPPKFDSEKIVNIISAQKDADGLSSPEQVQKCTDIFLLKNSSCSAQSASQGISEPAPSKETIPATARGVLALLDFYKISVKGKKIAVIGRSKLAGGPIAETLKARGGEVTVCHRSTENMPQICKASDLLISAAGQIGLVTKEFVNKGQTVIDVGINRTKEGKLVGDVAFDEVEPIVSAITPVPGGIGPLTVACLFENLLDLAYIKVL